MITYFITILYLTASTCIARPNRDFDTQNVVTVPTNCPDGQEWVNGACRDVWRSVTAAPPNVVTVPTNCPPGQAWINGACRDVWRSLTVAPPNVVTVPTNCPDGQEWINGACRDVWKSVDASPNNVVTVPTNCPTGQAWINGACRDIWRGILAQKNTGGLSSDLGDLFGVIRKALLRREREIENIEMSNQGVDSKNIISVPNQCPNGYRPDALGICRPTLEL